MSQTSDRQAQTVLKKSTQLTDVNDFSGGADVVVKVREVLRAVHQRLEITLGLLAPDPIVDSVAHFPGARSREGPAPNAKHATNTSNRGPVLGTDGRWVPGYHLAQQRERCPTHWPERFAPKERPPSWADRPMATGKLQ
jgi:hypothetical protein